MRGADGNGERFRRPQKGSLEGDCAESLGAQVP